MKLILIIFILSFYCYASARQFTVSLGKSETCQGFGVCGISNATQSGEKSDNEAMADITAANGKADFTFIKSTVTDKAFLKYFSTGYFVLESDYILSAQICETIGISSCVVKAGKYKVAETADGYEVGF